MPRCNCGFDFAQARLKGRRLESYAVISDKNYRVVIRKESAILVEKKRERRLTLIGNAAPLVGSLMRCPECGAWLLAKPLRGAGGAYTVLFKSKPTANKGKNVDNPSSSKGYLHSRVERIRVEVLAAPFAESFRR